MFYAFLVGLVLGVVLLHWRHKVAARESRRIPKEWPLKVRPLVNTREKRVWMWLSKVMFDQQILIKLPVTRFTIPANLEEATHWYKLLNGVYCTFTVCNTSGKVIGCIDVPGAKGLLKGNQTLKHSLLSQCDIRYWVVDSANLPHITQIRAAFLGEDALKGNESDQLESRFKHVRENLQAAVTRQRHNKSSAHSKSHAPAENSSDSPESRLASGWEQNSFVTPLDSRAAPLR